MIHTDESGNKVIYVDNSTLGLFRSCNEKCRLSTVESLRPLAESNPLVFGSAFHAGAALLNAGESLERAQRAFVDVWKERGSSLPLGIDSSDERRSVERGLVLLEGYEARWRNDPYTVMRRADGAAYTEIGFRMFLFEWKGIPVMYTGLIDGLVVSKSDGRARVLETKTTTMGLPAYIKRTKPNHQLTGYIWVAKEMLGIDVAGAIWDCVFVSDRKPNPKGDFYQQRGIDLEKDFARSLTTRSTRDIEEFLFDVKSSTRQLLEAWESGAPRWIRNTEMCHNYGGCQYTRICESNDHEVIIKNFYKKEAWEPWTRQLLPG